MWGLKERQEPGICVWRWSREEVMRCGVVDVFDAVF